MGAVEYQKKNHLSTITLNRPDKLNTFTEEVFTGLRECWTRYYDDDDAWIAILTAQGKAFSAGADKEWFQKTLTGEVTVDTFAQLTSKDPYWSGKLDKPVIAAVNGLCIGAGLDLVLRSDLRTAAEGAWFQQAEVRRGNVMVFFDNLPCAVAAEMIAGFRITAQRAYEVGMINRVTLDDQLMDKTMELAEELLTRQPLALYHALKLLRDIKNASAVVPRSLIDQYATQLSKRLMQTEDWKEGAVAFLQKKVPVYKKR
jgi:enoyl-CoA hydratase/carnithine racemase